MLKTYIQIRERVIALTNEEVGSEVAQATGVAIVAAAMLTVLVPFGGELANAVDKQFQNMLDQINK